MRHHPPRLAPPLAAAFSLFVAAFAVAQDTPTRFVAKDPMVRLRVDDLPALLAALPQTRLGKLFAARDVAAAIEQGRSNYVAKQMRWAHAVDRLLELDPARATVEMLVQREVIDLDWRDLASAALMATRLGDVDRNGVQTTMVIEPLAAVEGRLAQRFERLTGRLRTIAADADHPANLQLGADKVDGLPALVLSPRDGQDERWRYGPPPGAWLLHVPGQFVGGDGKAERVGRCVARRASDAAVPGISLQIDMLAYMDMLGGIGAGDPSVVAVMRALGLDIVRKFDWQLRLHGALLQDDIGLAVDGKPGGVLGALLDGMAPLVDQPLPEHGLLQLRAGFDVPTLIVAIDELLQQAEMPTLGEMGVVEDLRRAWTGGVALAVVRPAPGGLVPRLYASFGIVDQDAFSRLIARLHELPGLQPKQVTYEGKTCVQLRLDGAPPALQPSYCLQDGVVHFAESGISLRAMLKAAGGGAPPALDVGDAPRPDGPGAALPGFDLRFDGAAIHSALHELWLPIADTFIPMNDSMQPLVPMEGMPEPSAVAPHMRPGRGVLRRSPERIVLSMSGTAGGPELHVLLAAHGPLLSGPMTWSWKWQTEALQYELATIQLQRLHAAIGTFQQRTGKVPDSLGELLAAGDLADATLLRLPDDEETEPVVHEGKEVARTSFRYFPDGEKMSPQGQEIVARATSLRKLGWRRIVLADDGTLHDSWEAMQWAAPGGGAVELAPAVDADK
jgi:hypothetical protein